MIVINRKRKLTKFYHLSQNTAGVFQIYSSKETEESIIHIFSPQTLHTYPNILILLCKIYLLRSFQLFIHFSCEITFQRQYVVSNKSVAIENAFARCIRYKNKYVATCTHRVHSVSDHPRCQA